MTAAVAGAVLWVGDPTSLSCADPMTGRVRATWASPPPERVVAAEPTRVAVVAGGRLVMVPTDARCRPG